MPHSTPSAKIVLGQDPEKDTSQNWRVVGRYFLLLVFVIDSRRECDNHALTHLNSWRGKISGCVYFRPIGFGLY